MLTKCYTEKLRRQGMKKKINKDRNEGSRQNCCFLALKYMIREENFYWPFTLIRTYDNLFFEWVQPTQIRSLLKIDCTNPLPDPVLK